MNVLTPEIQKSISLLALDSNTYIQACVILVVYCVSYITYISVKKFFLNHDINTQTKHPVKRLFGRLTGVLYPFIAILLLQLCYEGFQRFDLPSWLFKAAIVIAGLIFFLSLVNSFVENKLPATVFKWVGLPVLFLHLIDVLPLVISVLESISIDLGNIKISMYGVFRVIIFGSFLFWLGRASNTFGKAVIRKQASLDISTKEVFSKLFEVSMFCIILLLLLNVMGINLTTLAVLGGALGVGLGLGLQSIASNFISGIIILLDRSLTVGDFVELDDGQKGFVREFKMRYAVLETYDGKDILVPNEKFISSMLVNWTHKDQKQRYRVDFSVAYATDIRSMVEIIKTTVAAHDQVLSGEGVLKEEQPDCEIDSFGDSGVNMFVEFWMYGIDDGRNRVGGDLMLLIFEALKENGIEIPFPQREVKIIGKPSI